MPKVLRQGELVEVPDFGEADADGRFVRWESRFRDVVTADPAADFPAEAGRYLLYVSYACPWAHRVLIARRLKRLEAAIPIAVVHPVMGAESWHFGDCAGCTPDPVFGAEFLYQVYLRADPRCSGVVNVPVLFDTRTRRIVNNESPDILRLLNNAFDAFGDASVDLYPEPLRAEIDRLNDLIYANVNNGVYRAGFARTQSAYEEAVAALFATLDTLEARLARQRFLVGDRPTEADWRLFTTLVRFDAVYYLHFKCNRRRLVDYPNLWDYTRDLYQTPGVADTVRLDHVKAHYYRSHPQLNPRGLVPVGPDLDFGAPHDRGRLAPEGGDLAM